MSPWLKRDANSADNVFATFTIGFHDRPRVNGTPDLNHDVSSSSRRGPDHDQLEARLAVPVLVAALISVPAVFLTMLDPPYSTVGTVANWVSMIVLTSESALLFVVSRDRLTWLRRNWWIVIVALLAIPAVIFAIGPVQLLRLVQAVGALRVLRANRIIKAARVLERHMDLEGRTRHGLFVLMSVLAASFVAIVLVDPTSTTRRLLEGIAAWVDAVLIVIAGIILAVATFVVVWVRNRSQRDEEAPADTDTTADGDTSADGGTTADGEVSTEAARARDHDSDV